MSLEFFESVAASGGSAAGGAFHLVVHRSPERSSWVSLPPGLASQLYNAGRAAERLVLELRPLVQRMGITVPGGPPCYVAWNGLPGQPGALGVPAGMLASLGLAEGRPVVARPLWDAPAAARVTVEPASEDDWEMVELNAEYLEDRLLEQVGVVCPHQPFPFWVHTHLIHLKVVTLDPPVPAAKLVPGTEVCIAPRVRARPAAGAASSGASEEGPALETGLRVQPVGEGLTAQLAAQAGQQGLPPMVQPIAVSPATLARCGLKEGDWVRLAGSGRKGGSGGGPAAPGHQQAVKFGSLAPCEDVAVGHVGLTAAQCTSFGVEAFTHVHVRRLGQAERQRVIEAAQLHQRAQHTAAAPSSAGGEGATEPGASGMAQQVAQQPAAAAWAWPLDGAEGEAEGPEAASWLAEPLDKAMQVLLPVLASSCRYLLQSWDVPRPGGLLVSGPAGSGKTALLASAAAALQQHPQCLAYPVVVRCREITLEGAAAGSAQALISAKVQEALDHMPSLLVFDDLDVLCHAESDGPEGAGAAADPGLVAWLCDVLDYLARPSLEWGVLPLGLAQQRQRGRPGEQHVASSISQGPAAGDRGESAGSHNGSSAAGDTTNGEQRSIDSSSGDGGSGGINGSGTAPSPPPAAASGVEAPSASLLWPPVAVAATCKDPAALSAPLRAAGRLDHPVSLPAPSADSRAAILAAGVRARRATAAPAALEAVAERADGFDAADLGVLLDRAMHLALRRRIAGGPPAAAGSTSSTSSSSSTAGGGTVPQEAAAAGGGRQQEGEGQLAAVKGGQGMELLEADLLGALEGMTPAAFWGVHTQKSVQQGVSGWEDVGGMDEVRQALYESLELPTKFPKLVAQAPLRLRTGVLLYGPPGCGKTHVVSAAVAAANVRCITVSGPELLNKYIGASEAAVRDVFRRAAAAAPSVLFFDEFDAIAPQRGHDNTGVTDRVVNQLLTELDGVEGLRGVCVIAATSRPDLIDAALLRPGRLDRLLYCGFPTPMERHKILIALSRSLQLAPDVDLYQLAYEADDFSGADLSAVVSEAQLAVVHETLEAEGAAAGKPGAPPGAAEPPPPLHKHRHAGGAPTLQQRHLRAALDAARPSVPEPERLRLEAVYRKFQQSREPGGGQAAAVDKGKGKKVSWA